MRVTMTVVVDTTDSRMERIRRIQERVTRNAFGPNLVSVEVAQIEESESEFGRLHPLAKKWLSSEE